MMDEGRTWRDQMMSRTKTFGVRIIKLVSALPNNRIGDTLGRQILRSGTSVGANYHEACHASSNRHFVTTLEIAQREARETEYWLTLIVEADLLPLDRVDPLAAECGELVAIFTTSIRTAKGDTQQDV
jgi:four helix bundle protein